MRSYLLTNDDGIHAPGMEALANAVADLDGEAESVIIAPAQNRSAIGHGITLGRPICIRQIEASPQAPVRISVDGTPADAVKYAVKNHFPTHPHIALSGINAGPNVGTNILYSGTVAAALEAYAHGIPSIALSIEGYEDPQWDEASAISRSLIAWALAHLDHNPTPFCLNVNIPACPLQDVRGFCWTQMGRSGFDEQFFTDETKADHFHLGGVMRHRDPNASYDFGALQEGYVSITPLSLNLTDYQQLDAHGAGSLPTLPR